MADMDITSEEQYDEALNQVYVLMQTHPVVDSLEGMKLEELVTLIERYEAIHYPMTKQE